MSFLVVALLGLNFAACRPASHFPAKAAPVAATRPVAIPVGVVAVVNDERHFVLVDLQSHLFVPTPGMPLRCRNSAGATAHLRAAPQQKRPFIAADILDGQPAVGDEVVR